MNRDQRRPNETQAAYRIRLHIQRQDEKRRAKGRIINPPMWLPRRCEAADGTTYTRTPKGNLVRTSPRRHEGRFCMTNASMRRLG